MRANDFHPCTFERACWVLWAYQVLNWSQTKIAIELDLNVGTVCHIVHGRRYPSAHPVPIPGHRAA